MLPYMIKYKNGKENIVVDALLTSLQTKLLGFKFVKDLYATNSNFGKVRNSCSKHAFGNYYRHDGFLFQK